MPTNYYLVGYAELMLTRKNMLKGLVAGSFVAGSILAPIDAFAQTPPPGYDSDPAHHSTDVNDPDPAHHRPILVFSASTNEWVLTPIAGFDLNGYPVGGSTPGTTTPTPPPGYDPDPAHHSTDVNDPDPAHHRPYYVYADGTWRLVPVPGFDLNGYPVESGTFS